MKGFSQAREMMLGKAPKNSALLWAFGLDWVFWQILPTGAVLAGGALVIATGLYIIADERRTPAPG